MVDFNINVIARTGSAANDIQDLEEGLDDTTVAADRTRNAINRALRAATVVIAAVAGVTALTNRYNDLQRQLRTVTGDTNNLNAVSRLLAQTANDTRAGLGQTVDVYTQTALAVRGLGLSQRDVIDFTRTLNQAIRLSGTSAEQAQQGITALTRGLSEGSLAGAQLDTVLTRLPAVADLIAAEFGVTRGELALLGAQGRITAQDVINAFRNQAVEIQAAFDQTNATVGEAFNQLRDNVLLIAGSFVENIGLTTAFASTLEFLAANIDLVAVAVGGLAVALGASLALRALPLVVRGVLALTAALATNPITAGLVVASITAAAVAFNRLGGDLRTTIRDFLGLDQNTEELERQLLSASEAQRLFGTTSDRAASAARNQAEATAGLNAELNRTATSATAAASAFAGLSAIEGRGGGRGPVGGGEDGRGQVLTRGRSPAAQLREDFIRVFGSAPPALVSGDLSVEEGRALFNRQLQARIRRNEQAGQLDRTPIRFGGRGAPDRDLPGFQFGGSFTVAGRSGTDRNLLSLNGQPVARVSSGEDVNISPRGRSSAPQVVINVTARDADSFQRSQGQILTRAQAALTRGAFRNSGR